MSVCMQEWASLIFIVVALYMVVSALFALMFWGIVVRRLILIATTCAHAAPPTNLSCNPQQEQAGGITFDLGLHNSLASPAGRPYHCADS